MEILANENVITLTSGPIYEFVALNFLYMALVLFILCSVILIAVSYSAPAPTEEKTKNLTYESGKFDWNETMKSKEFALSVLLVITIAAVWIYFS